MFAAAVGAAGVQPPGAVVRGLLGWLAMAPPTAGPAGHAGRPYKTPRQWRQAHIASYGVLQRCSQRRQETMFCPLHARAGMQRDAEHSMPREQGERRVGKVSWVVPKDPNVTSRDPSCGRPYWSRSLVPPCPRHLLLGLNYDYTTLLAGVCAVSCLGRLVFLGPLCTCASACVG